MVPKGGREGKRRRGVAEEGVGKHFISVIDKEACM